MDINPTLTRIEINLEMSYPPVGHMHFRDMDTLLSMLLRSLNNWTQMRNMIVVGVSNTIVHIAISTALLFPSICPPLFTLLRWPVYKIMKSLWTTHSQFRTG